MTGHCGSLDKGLGAQNNLSSGDWLIKGIDQGIKQPDEVELTQALALPVFGIEVGDVDLAEILGWRVALVLHLVRY